MLPLNTRLARTALPLALLLLMLIVTACATTEQMRKVEPTGFLKNYEQLREGTGDDALLTYTKPGLSLMGYDYILLEPIAVWSKDEKTLEGLSEQDRINLSRYLEQSIKNKLIDRYRFVKRSGPGVLRLRVAITEARGSRVVGDTLSNILPPMLIMSFGKELATGTHAFVGRAGVEAELLDSVTGERLMAAVDARAGEKVLRGKFGKWNDVKEAFDLWAERLATRMASYRRPAPTGE